MAVIYALRGFIGCAWCAVSGAGSFLVFILFLFLFLGLALSEDRLRFSSWFFFLQSLGFHLKGRERIRRDDVCLHPRCGLMGGLQVR
jgi:hypothetical protein